jgi:hypothetical protein
MLFGSRTFFKTSLILLSLYAAKHIEFIYFSVAQNSHLQKRLQNDYTDNAWRIK